MKFEDIMALAKEDAKLDHTEIGTESIKLTDLKVKWLNIYSPERVLLAKMRKERAKLFKTRWEYYLGKAAPEVYAAAPLDIKILKDNVDIYLNADPELQEMDAKIDLQDEKVAYLKEFVRVLHDRGYSIKNALEHMKFIAGA